MRSKICRPAFVLLLTLAGCSVLIPALAQNQNQNQSQDQSQTQGQSLADIARQQKKQQQKQKPASKVYTDEDMGHSGGSTASSGNDNGSKNSDNTAPTGTEKLSDAQWRENIKRQKQVVNTLQDQTDKLKASIHYVVADAYRDSGQAVRYNEAQKRHQDEADRMQHQLEGEKKKLEEMQDACRKQGFGTNVCE